MDSSWSLDSLQTSPTKYALPTHELTANEEQKLSSTPCYNLESASLGATKKKPDKNPKQGYRRDRMMYKVWGGTQKEGLKKSGQKPSPSQEEKRTINSFRNYLLNMKQIHTHTHPRSFMSEPPAMKPACQPDKGKKG